MPPNDRHSEWPNFQADPVLKEMLEGAADVGSALQRFTEEGRFREAYRLAACALPLREAVWWGCLCVWDAARPAALALSTTTPAWSAHEDAALLSAVAWTRQPSDDATRLALAAGDAAGLDTPAGALALAAAWSCSDDRRRSSAAVAGAAHLAALRGGPDPDKSRLLRYLGLAIEVARHENRWN